MASKNYQKFSFFLKFQNSSFFVCVFFLNIKNNFFLSTKWKGGSAYLVLVQSLQNA